MNSAANTSTAASLAFSCALGIGTARFLGGLASRRATAVSVALSVQIVGILLILLLLPLFLGVGIWRAPAVTIASVLMALISGLAAGAALTAFFQAVRIEGMGIVSLITASGSATIPLLWGVAFGERPHPLQVVGIACGFAAIILVLTEKRPATAPPLQGIALALCASVGVGTFYILFHAAASAGIFAALAVRVGAATVITTTAIISGASLLSVFGAWRLVVAASVLYLAGDSAFLLASSQGLLSLTALLASFASPITALLARVFLHERMRPTQAAGACAAVLSVLLIAGG